LDRGDGAVGGGREEREGAGEAVGVADFLDLNNPAKA
jgi:hypothetical protein